MLGLYFQSLMDTEKLRACCAQDEVEFGQIPAELIATAQRADLATAQQFPYTVCFPRRCGLSGVDMSVHDYILVWSGPLQRRGDLRRRCDVHEALLVAPDRSVALLGRIVTAGDYQGHHTHFYVDACQRL